MPPNEKTKERPTSAASPAAAARLAEIALRDPTGGLRMLDCPHDFNGLCIVVLPDTRWLIMSAWEITSKCSYSRHGQVVFAHFIERCPFCEHKRDDPDLPLRDYVLGEQDVRDEQLLAFGFLGEEKGHTHERD